MSVQPTAFDHVHLRSLDPEAAARFYADRLGATDVRRVETPEMLRMTLKLAGQDVFIDRVPAGTRPAPERPHLALEHIGLRVADLDAAVAALKAEGVRFTMDPKDMGPGLRIAFLLGPDDVLIELLQRG